VKFCSLAATGYLTLENAHNCTRPFSEIGPSEDPDGSGDPRVSSAVRKIPPILVKIPEKMLNASYASPAMMMTPTRVEESV
jgi:hypothetical protein